MIPLFLFQLCIAVTAPDGDLAYNCSIDVFILENQQEVQVWHDEIYERNHDGKKWDGWPIQAFWHSDNRWIVLHDTEDFFHEYMHAFCWMNYYYEHRENHPWCEDKPHWKIQF